MFIFILLNYSLQTLYVMVTEFATNNQALLYEVDTNTTPLLIIALIGITFYYARKTYLNYKSSKRQ